MLAFPEDSHDFHKLLIARNGPLFGKGHLPHRNVRFLRIPFFFLDHLGFESHYRNVFRETRDHRRLWAFTGKQDTFILYLVTGMSEEIMVAWCMSCWTSDHWIVLSLEFNGLGNFERMELLPVLNGHVTIYYLFLILLSNLVWKIIFIWERQVEFYHLQNQINIVKQDKCKMLADAILFIISNASAILIPGRFEAWFPWKINSRVRSIWAYSFVVDMGKWPLALSSRR